MQWTILKDSGEVQEMIEKHIPTRKVKTGGNRDMFPIHAQTRDITRKKCKV